MKTLIIIVICLISSFAFASDFVSIFESQGSVYIITPDSPQAVFVGKSVKTEPVKTDLNQAKKINLNLMPDVADVLNFFWIQSILK